MIAGLGEKTDFVASVPGIDADRLNLTADERALFGKVGRAAQISQLVQGSQLPEAKAIALLLSLRAKGAIVPAKVKPGGPSPALAPVVPENIELSDERKREIHALEGALEGANLFAVFALPAGAAPEAVRKAFYELSRKFHPDRYFGKNLGSYRARVEIAYRKLSQAHETLTDEARRRAYLKAHPELQAPASAPGRAGAPSRGAEPQRPRTAEDEAREAERRQRFSKHPYFAKSHRIKELLARAREHMDKGEHGHAFTALHMAHQIDAANDEVKTLLAEARAKNDVQRAEADLQRGLQLLDEGKEAQALSAFRSAANVDPKNAKATYMAAKLMWDKSGDPKDVLLLAQRAVEAAPKSADYHLLLARVMDQANMKVLSKKHFEEALRLDPSNAEAKKHVKGRWPF